MFSDISFLCILLQNPYLPQDGMHHILVKMLCVIQDDSAVTFVQMFCILQGIYPATFFY